MNREREISCPSITQQLNCLIKSSQSERELSVRKPVWKGSQAITFNGTATSEEWLFRCTYSFSKMFVRSLQNLIPKTRQGFGRKTDSIPLSFPARRLLVLHIQPEGGKFNQLYFLDYEFPDLKKANYICWMSRVMVNFLSAHGGLRMS